MTLCLARRRLFVSKSCRAFTKLRPAGDLNAHFVDLPFDVGIGEDPRVITSQEMAARDALQLSIVFAAVDDHLSDSGLQFAKGIQISLLSFGVIFALVELIQLVNGRQTLRFQQANIVAVCFRKIRIALSNIVA